MQGRINNNNIKGFIEMRTIKFKAKRQDNGQWVTGDLLQHLDGDVLIGDNTGPWTDC